MRVTLKEEMVGIPPNAARSPVKVIRGDDRFTKRSIGSGTMASIIVVAIAMGSRVHKDCHTTLINSPEPLPTTTAFPPDISMTEGSRDSTTRPEELSTGITLPSDVTAKTEM